MEYNSQREPIVISEYGRHIQGLIQYAQNIEDREERQDYVERIVKYMDQLLDEPVKKGETEERLWKHVFKIADYQLDVDAPEGINVSRQDEDRLSRSKPEYPVINKKSRHYGKNILKMIAAASEIEDEEKRIEYAKLIASYMKLANVTYNDDYFMNNKMIIQDLYNLSDGKITLESSEPLDIYISNAEIKAMYKDSKTRSKKKKSGKKKRRKRTR